MSEGRNSISVGELILIIWVALSFILMMLMLGDIARDVGYLCGYLAKGCGQ